MSVLNPRGLLGLLGAGRFMVFGTPSASYETRVLVFFSYSTPSASSSAAASPKASSIGWCSAVALRGLDAVVVGALVLLVATRGRLRYAPDATKAVNATQCL
ncbi:hypothetical protein [Streptomyces yerevanensis]|uniref:hypothetical protein n=1 Tax=Streptomyces yerevanensis TaxID=66378 RepID=UPI00052642C5|nr:hypothetical protein [Streptomyces yerevanensis]